MAEREYNTTVYVIGERESGIIIVSLDPLKIQTVSKEGIQRYADEVLESGNYDNAYHILLRAIVTLVADMSESGLQSQVDHHREAIQALIADNKVKMVNTDVCIMGKIDLSLHGDGAHTHSRRKSYSMLHNAVETMQAAKSDVNHMQGIDKFFREVTLRRNDE